MIQQQNFKRYINNLLLRTSAVVILLMLSFVTVYASSGEILDKSINMQNYPKAIDAQPKQNGDIVLSAEPIKRNSTPEKKSQIQIGKTNMLPEMQANENTNDDKF